MNVKKETRGVDIGTALNNTEMSVTTEGATKVAASDTNSGAPGSVLEITRKTIKDAFLEKEDIQADDKMVDAVLTRMWGYLTGEELNRAYKQRRLEKRKAATNAA